MAGNVYDPKGSPRMTIDLAPYDGRPVIQTPVSITRAGDGLSKAMKVDAVDLHIGQTVTVVLECSTAAHTLEPMDPDDPSSPLIRKQVLRAGRATIVDPALVGDLLDEQQRRIEEAEGKQRLDFPEVAEPGVDGPDDETVARIVGQTDAAEQRAAKAAEQRGPAKAAAKRAPRPETVS